MDVAVLDGAGAGELADGPLELLHDVVLEGRGDLDVVAGDGDGDGLGGHSEGRAHLGEVGLGGKGDGRADEAGNDGGGEAHGSVRLLLDAYLRLMFYGKKKIGIEEGRRQLKPAGSNHNPEFFRLDPLISILLEKA